MDTHNCNFIVVVFAAGCTTQPQTYNSNGLSFQYPGDWNKDYKNDIQQSFGDSADVLVSLGKDNAGIVVAKIKISGVTVNDLASAFKSSMQSSGYEFVSEKTRTVDGVNALEIVIKETSSGIYGSCVFFQKNGVIYFIMIGTSNNDQTTVDMILNSFKVQ